MSSFYTNIQLAGDTILYRGYENGQRVEFRAQFSPTLYVLSKMRSSFKLWMAEQLPLYSLSTRKARDFIKQYEGVEGFEVHGYERFVYQYIRQEFPGDVKYDTNKMKIYALDIEVQCENGFPDVEAAAEEMLSITIKDMVTKQYYCWCTREFVPPKSVEMNVFWTEHEMLNGFIKWWAENTPDILTGWNVNLYDVPYIARRVNRVLGEKWMKSLSPWNRANERRSMSKGVKIMLTISLVSIFLTIWIYIASLHTLVKNLTDSITLLSSNSVKEKLITLNTKTSRTSIPLIGRSSWNTTSKTLN